MSDALLAINAGSSSIKFGLFTAGADIIPLARGKLEGIGTAPHLIVHDADGQVLTERRWEDGADMAHEAFFDAIFGWIEGHLAPNRLIGVGHRIVHGGASFADPVIATRAVIAELEALCPLAPLHQPHNLAAVRAAAGVRKHLPQILCFDTGFHRTQPAVATRFGIPHALEEEGVRRYGFHGISYAYIARRLAEIDPTMARGRVIAAHLGNGASLCAMADGRSLDTTMGFTALDGLVMGTRCGAIDPGVLLYLQQSKGMDADALTDLLYNRSGLLGVSGASSDMRNLLDSDAPLAKAAVELFVYRVAREAGALASSLGGLDGIVFTAGIGENAAPVRAAICRRLAWLGVALDDAANDVGAAVISTADSRVRVRVVPTNEERMIAIHVRDLLAATAKEAS
ncbi:acetate/propionate family kinase [Hephaestia mangrovi]|uniref:acetate/propionate family kinase n=1 Tax=Hephaestia mangrovi TaxID=2873268 RepID=UPI001CA7A9E1|nr:acetate/propionate family kinase [Hephaestia mangrovi]MBY8826551.1 acetate/propionate family kinase [Hephaestia mangrovi]